MLNRLDHGELLAQVGRGGLGIRRGQGGKLGVFKVIGLARGLRLLLVVLASAKEAPRHAAAGGLGIAVVAGGLGGSGADQAVALDVVSVHVVAAGAGHE